MFCSPIAFNMPAGVSARRGMGFPRRGLRVVPLEMIAPRRCTSITRAYSVPHPKQPEAAITGFSRQSACFRFCGPNATDKSTLIISPSDEFRPHSNPLPEGEGAPSLLSPGQIAHLEDRAVFADALHLTALVLDNATETGAHSTGHILLQGELHRLVHVGSPDYLEHREEHRTRATCVHLSLIHISEPTRLG